MIPRQHNWEKTFNREIIINAEIETEFTRSSSLYLTHRAELLSHYKNSPSYVVGGPNPRDAAKALIRSFGYEV